MSRNSTVEVDVEFSTTNPLDFSSPMLLLTDNTVPSSLCSSHCQAKAAAKAIPWPSRAFARCSHTSGNPTQTVLQNKEEAGWAEPSPKTLLRAVAELFPFLTTITEKQQRNCDTLDTKHKWKQPHSSLKC